MFSTTPPSFQKITEQAGAARHLEQEPVERLLQIINGADLDVAPAVHSALHQITAFVEAAAVKLLSGGRLFYIGAGTSGRLGILDASELPPTYGVPQGLVTGIIAGGPAAITGAVEGAEDDLEQGWRDLQAHGVSSQDIVLGLAASGTTPYVLGALAACREQQVVTGSLCCNPAAPISALAVFPIEVVVGPEVVTGSTRMKAGTAQKMVLNMISTTLMIRMGRVADNRMVDMQLNNEKLLDRGVRMLMEQARINDYNAARSLLVQAGSVRQAMDRLSGQGSSGDIANKK